MNKTISININGQQFVIDDEAYEKLHHYLETIKKHYSDTEECRDIITDIEARIAELLSNNRASQSSIVSLSDIENIIEQLGYPEDFEPESDSSDPQAAPIGKKKKLYRDTNNKIVAGVCSGLAKYLNFDLTALRIIFILLIPITAFNFLWVYLVLWLIIPEAQTPSQRLEMEGDSININNIEKKIKKGYNDAKKSYDEYVKSDDYKHIKTKSQSFWNGLSKVGKVLLGILLAFIAVGISIFLYNAFLHAFHFEFHTTGSGLYAPWLNFSLFRWILFIPIILIIVLLLKSIFKVHISLKIIILVLALIWISKWLFAFVFGITGGFYSWPWEWYQ